MALDGPPSYYFNGIDFNNSYFQTPQITSSSGGGMTQAQGDVRYLNKVMPDTSSVLETFSGGIKSSTISAVNTNDAVLIFNNLVGTGSVKIGVYNSGLYVPNSIYPNSISNVLSLWDTQTAATTMLNALSTNSLSLCNNLTTGNLNIANTAFSGTMNIGTSGTGTINLLSPSTIPTLNSTTLTTSTLTASSSLNSPTISGTTQIITPLVNATTVAGGTITATGAISGDTVSATTSMTTNTINASSLSTPTNFYGNVTSGLQELYKSITNSGILFATSNGATMQFGNTTATTAIQIPCVINSRNSNALVKLWENVTGAAAGANFLNTMTTGTINFATAMTTGIYNLATGSGYSGSINIATGGTMSGSVNIATATTASGNVNIASGAGGTSTITIGNTTGGTLNLNSPTINITGTPSFTNMFKTQNTQSTLARTYAVNYQNSSTTPRFVSASFNAVPSGEIWSVYCDATPTPTTLILSVNIYSNQSNLFWVVLPNYYYRVQRTGSGTIISWTEWN